MAAAQQDRSINGPSARSRRNTLGGDLVGLGVRPHRRQRAGDFLRKDQLRALVPGDKYCHGRLGFYGVSLPFAHMP